MSSQHFSYPQLETLWVRAGGSRNMAPVMAAIAEVESSGDSEPTPGKIGNNPGTADGLPGAIGLEQMEWPLYQGYGGAETPEQMLDPLTNMRAAVELAAGDPSTAPGHPIFDNWIQWEHPAGAYQKFLSYGPGAGANVGPVSNGPTIGIGPFHFGLPNPLAGLLGDVKGLAVTSLVIAAAAAAAVIGVARVAKSRGQP